MSRISSGAILMCLATLLKILATAAGLSRAPIRSGIVRSFGSLPDLGGFFGGNPVPMSRLNTAPFVICASSNHS